MLEVFVRSFSKISGFDMLMGKPTAGVAVVCLVYLDGAGPAHMRYSVRRLRRKVPRRSVTELVTQFQLFEKRMEDGKVIEQLDGAALLDWVNLGTAVFSSALAVTVLKSIVGLCI